MGERVIDVMESVFRAKRFDIRDVTAGTAIASFFYETVGCDVRADTPWGHVAAEGRGYFSLNLRLTLDEAPFAEVHVAPMMMKYVIKLPSGHRLTFKSWRLGTEYRYEGHFGRLVFKPIWKPLSADRHVMRVSASDLPSADLERLVLILLTTFIFMADVGPQGS